MKPDEHQEGVGGMFPSFPLPFVAVVPKYADTILFIYFCISKYMYTVITLRYIQCMQNLIKLISDRDNHRQMPIIEKLSIKYRLIYLYNDV